MAKVNDYLPDGTITTVAAQRNLRGIPGAKLVFSAGNYFVVPGGRIAAPSARRIISRHLTVVDVGLFAGCPQSWAWPAATRSYRTVGGYLRAVGARIGRQRREAAQARQPYSPVDDQRCAINIILANHNVARIADSEAPADALVRMYQQMSPRDDDHRRLIAACMKWVIGPMGRRTAATHEPASEPEIGSARAQPVLQRRATAPRPEEVSDQTASSAAECKDGYR